MPGQAGGHGRERRSGRWQRAMKQGGAVGGQIAAGDAHGCAAVAARRLEGVRDEVERMVLWR